MLYLVIAMFSMGEFTYEENMIRHIAFNFEVQDLLNLPPRFSKIVVASYFTIISKRDFFLSHMTRLVDVQLF